MPPIRPNTSLGYDAEALAHSPYAAYYRPTLAPLAEPVRAALAVGALATELLPPVGDACRIQDEGYQTVETGYALTPEGGARLAVLTPMPGVAPAMWDWWFAWHGSEALRYKLWHPQAHLDVGWRDGDGERPHYVGRVSEVEEYVGSERVRASVAFVAPSAMGLDERRLAERGEVAICARLGMVIAGLPLYSGWLLHQLRPVPGGAEMRSRFWLGGADVRLFGWENRVGAALGHVAARLKPVQSAQAQALMVHDAQEMGHLAAILPELYAAFGPGSRA